MYQPLKKIFFAITMVLSTGFFITNTAHNVYAQVSAIEDPLILNLVGKLNIIALNFPAEINKITGCATPFTIKGKTYNKFLMFQLTGGVWKLVTPGEALRPLQGYLVFTGASCQLTIPKTLGFNITKLPLSPGWNIISSQKGKSWVNIHNNCEMGVDQSKNGNLDASGQPALWQLESNGTFSPVSPTKSLETYGDFNARGYAVYVKNQCEIDDSRNDTSGGVNINDNSIGDILYGVCKGTISWLDAAIRTVLGIAGKVVAPTVRQFLQDTFGTGTADVLAKVTKLATIVENSGIYTELGASSLADLIGKVSRNEIDIDTVIQKAIQKSGGIGISFVKDDVSHLVTSLAQSWQLDSQTAYAIGQFTNCSLNYLSTKNLDQFSKLTNTELQNIGLACLSNTSSPLLAQLARIKDLLLFIDQETKISGDLNTKFQQFDLSISFIQYALTRQTFTQLLALNDLQPLLNDFYNQTGSQRLTLSAEGLKILIQTLNSNIIAQFKLDIRVVIEIRGFMKQFGNIDNLVGYTIDALQQELSLYIKNNKLLAQFTVQYILQPVIAELNIKLKAFGIDASLFITLSNFLAFANNQGYDFSHLLQDISSGGSQIVTLIAQYTLTVGSTEIAGLLNIPKETIIAAWIAYNKLSDPTFRRTLAEGNILTILQDLIYIDLPKDLPNCPVITAIASLDPSPLCEYLSSANWRAPVISAGASISTGDDPNDMLVFLNPGRSGRPAGIMACKDIPNVGVFWNTKPDKIPIFDLAGSIFHFQELHLGPLGLDFASGKLWLDMPTMCGIIEHGAKVVAIPPEGSTKIYPQGTPLILPGDSTNRSETYVCKNIFNPNIVDWLKLDIPWLRVIPKENLEASTVATIKAPSNGGISPFFGTGVDSIMLATALGLPPHTFIKSEQNPFNSIGGYVPSSGLLHFEYMWHPLNHFTGTLCRWDPSNSPYEIGFSIKKYDTAGNSTYLYRSFIPINPPLSPSTPLEEKLRLQKEHPVVQYGTVSVDKGDTIYVELSGCLNDQVRIMYKK